MENMITATYRRKYKRARCTASICSRLPILAFKDGHHAVIDVAAIPEDGFFQRAFARKTNFLVETLGHGIRIEHEKPDSMAVQEVEAVFLESFVDRAPVAFPAKLRNYIGADPDRPVDRIVLVHSHEADERVLLVERNEVELPGFLAKRL